MFLFAIRADHNRVPAHVDAATHCQAAFHRVAERPPVGVVNNREQFPDAVPHSVITIRAGQCLRREIHVIDTSIVVRRNDAFGDRLQRVLRLALTPAQRYFEAFSMTDIPRHGKNRRTAVKLDDGALRFDPKAGFVAVDQLYFQSSRYFFMCQVLGHRFAKKRSIGRFHEIGDLTPDQLRGIEPDQTRGRFVGQQYLLVVNDDDLRQGPGKVRKKPVPALNLLVALTKGVKQPIDCPRQLRRIRILRHRQSAANRRILGRLEHLLIESRHSPGCLPPADPKHNDDHDRGQKQGRQDDDDV